jgi:hypothetical protein
MAVASFKVEADHESTEATTMIITCARMGCRRPVRKELIDDGLPMCDEHQGLFVDHQRWAVHSPTRGWLVDVAERVFSWDADTARQWSSPEVLGQDLQASGLSERVSFLVQSSGKPTVVQAGLLFLRMR